MQSQHCLIFQFVLFLMEAGNLNFYVNSHNLHNLTSSLSKQTNTMCCGQNKIQLEEDEAHGLFVPTSDTDTTHAFPASWGSDSDIHFWSQSLRPLWATCFSLSFLFLFHQSPSEDKLWAHSWATVLVTLTTWYGAGSNEISRSLHFPSFRIRAHCHKVGSLPIDPLHTPLPDASTPVFCCKTFSACQRVLG